jgi:hypothetical protein
MEPICAILYRKSDVDHAMKAAKEKGIYADTVEWHDYYVFRVYPAICLPRFPF